MNKGYYYVTGNTAEGFVNFLHSNLVDIQQTIILKHPSDSVKTIVLKKLIEKYEPDHHLEVICSALGRDFLDGMIIREKSLAIITDTIATSNVFGKMIIDFEKDQPNAVDNDSNIAELQRKFKEVMQKSYKSFANGLKVHDDLEAIYINEMDFNKADELTDTFIKDLLDHIPNKNRKPHVYVRLFGTSTFDGMITVVPHLIRNISKVCYVKGRAGTGKSVFMRKVAKACTDHGFDVEIYRCSFDPHSVDMVRVPELDFCMFDSTDPHEFHPERSEDIVVDLYEKTVTPGTDEKFADKINEVASNYKANMKKGVDLIQKAGEYHQQLQHELARKKVNNVDDVLEAIEALV